MISSERFRVIAGVCSLRPSAAVFTYQVQGDLFKFSSPVQAVQHRTDVHTFLSFAVPPLMSKGGTLSTIRNSLITARYSVRAHTLALNSAILTNTIQSSQESEV